MADPSDTYTPSDLIHKVDAPTDVVSGLSDGIFYVRDYNDTVAVRAGGVELEDAVVSILVSKADGQARQEKGTPWVLDSNEWADMLRLLDRVRVAIGVLPGEESGRSLWHSTEEGGAPSQDVGSVGDFYLDPETGTVYLKTFDPSDAEAPAAWVDTGNIRGSAWFTGSGTPDDDLGKDFDLYLFVDTGDVYEKLDGTWELVGNIKGASGAFDGPNAATWYESALGGGSPDVNIGSNGDFYYDEDTGDVYQKAVASDPLTYASMISGGGEAFTGLPGGVIGVTGGATFNPSANKLYLCAVVLRDAGGSPKDITGVTSNGMSWVLVKSVTFGNARLSVFRGQRPSGLSSGNVGFSFTGLSASGGSLVYGIMEVSGSPSTGSDGSNAVAQPTSNAALGVQALSVTLGAPLGDNSNVAAFFATTDLAAGAVLGPEAGWTELFDKNSSPGFLEINGMWDESDVSPSVSWAGSGNANAGGVAVEIVSNVTGSVWTVIGNIGGAGGGSETKVATSADRTTTSTTLVDVPDLTAPLLANHVYEFEAVLWGESSTTAGTRYAITFSAAGSTGEVYYFLPTSTGNFLEGRVATGSQTGIAFTANAATPAVVILKGIIVVGANAGNLTVQQLKVTGGTANVHKGSTFKVRQTV